MFDYLSYIEEYDKRNLDYYKKQERSKDVFLTIITRTQGRRERGLKEVALSLFAQTDMNFEWLIIGHRLDSEKIELVNQIIEQQPEELRQRIEFYNCQDKSRGAPLNFGYSKASGQYVAFLDDDDVVFHNWVEAFHELAKKGNGQILHAFVAGQFWKKISVGLTKGGLQSTSNFDKRYCKNYNWIEQLNYNSCPLLGLAFPRNLFHEFGLTFDESLSTTEDWDFLVRATNIVGLLDIPHVTSVYRWWDNIENSSTQHSKEEWEKNYFIIREKIKRRPLIIPPEGVKQLLESSKIDNENYKNNMDRIIKWKEIKYILKMYIKNKYFKNI